MGACFLQMQGKPRLGSPYTGNKGVIRSNVQSRSCASRHVRVARQKVWLYGSHIKSNHAFTCPGRGGLRKSSVSKCRRIISCPKDDGVTRTGFCDATEELMHPKSDFHSSTKDPVYLHSKKNRYRNIYAQKILTSYYIRLTIRIANNFKTARPRMCLLCHLWTLTSPKQAQ